MRREVVKKLSMLIDTVFDVPTYFALKLSCDTQQIWISNALITLRKLKFIIIKKWTGEVVCYNGFCYGVSWLRKKYNLLTKQDVNYFMTLSRRVYYLIHKKHFHSSRFVSSLYSCIVFIFILCTLSSMGSETELTISFPCLP